MLVSIYAFVKKKFSSRFVNVVGTRSRSLNQMRPFREINRGYDDIESFDAYLSNAIEERIFKIEIKLLDAIEKKLDDVNRRIDDAIMHK